MSQLPVWIKKREKKLDVLIKLAELYDIIAKHSNKTYDEVVKDGDRDFWMNSQEALEYGMIDEVLKKK